jgi:TldD protein
VSASAPLDLLVELMAVAEGRCAYAEARHVDRVDEQLGVRDGRVEQAALETSGGLGVRVRVGGAWGFAATRDATREGAERALARALAVAQAQPAAPDRARVDEPPARGSWTSARAPGFIDPFAVSLEDKLALLLAADEAMRGDPRLVRTDAGSSATRVVQAFASTDGAACTQERIECGAGIAAVAVDGGELQIRSYPSAHGGDVRQAGWEHVVALDLAGHAPRVAAEAVELLSAPPCPSERTTLVLGAEQLSLQIHESIGHALELDRIQLGEAAYAGTSWVGEHDFADPLRYGSEHLTITGRRDDPRRAGDLRLGRRGHRRPAARR